MSDDRTRSLDFDPDAARPDGVPLLEIVAGPLPPQRVLLPDRGLVIGRGDDADLVLEADGVSRKHARVVNNTAGIVNVLDLGSTNGTFLNGRRVDVAVLREGDQLRIGQVVLRFAYGAEDDPVPTQPIAAQLELSKVLTARELEVARLVAQGLTNGQIGGQLHISPRTVATHLANIFERLGIHSRAALANYVARFGD